MRKVRVALPADFPKFVEQHPEMTRRALARHFGVHYVTICTAMRNMFPDKPIGQGGQRKRLPPDAEVADMASRFGAKATAEEMGCSLAAVYKAIGNARGGAS